MLVVNALTRETVATLTTASDAISDFAIADADADNDGVVDVVALSATALYIFNPTTLAHVRTVSYGDARLDESAVLADLILAVPDGFDDVQILIAGDLA